ncbi:MAG: FAD-dependent oxidoreductase [Bacteroidota bacterium]
MLDKFSREWNLPLVHKTGAIWLFQSNPVYGTASAEVLQQYAYKFAEMDLAKAEAQFPQINFSDIQRVFFEADAGFMEARRVCQWLVNQFQKEEGDFRLAAVKPGPQQNEKLQSLQLSDGTTIEVDQYVFACGPWNKKLFPELFQQHIYVSRQEVYYFGLPSNAAPFLAPQLPIWLDFDDDEILHYGIPDHKYRGFKVAYDIREQSIDPTHDDRSPTPAILERSRKFLAHRFPALKNAPLLETRVCNYENSPDGHFLIDRHPALHNVIVAGGSSGHGYKMGSAVGELIAQHLLLGKALDPFFSLQRLKRLKQRSNQFFSQQKG